MQNYIHNWIGILCLLFVCTSCDNKSEKTNLDQQLKPNIILVLADDMGYSDLSCYGGEIQTPNIDALAQEGIRFSQFYNAARCCPTRASLLTGLYPHQAGMGKMITKEGKGVEGPYQGYLSKNSVTIAEVLKSEGYYTAMSGKWHVGEERPHWPTERGFDNYFGLISGAANYFDLSKTKNKGQVRHFAIDSTEFVPEKEGFYMTNAITENAIKYIRKAESNEQPFFLYLAYTAPHWPLQALKEDIDLYRGKFKKGWDQLREERFIRMKDMGLVDDTWPISERNEAITAWEELNEELKDRMDLLMAIYAAQIHRMDQGIGEIMKQLEDSGQKENTLVMFLSDNGASAEYDPLGTDFWKDHGYEEGTLGTEDTYLSYGSSWANLSNTPYRYFKKRTFEGGIATPFIVNWPGHIKNKGSITNSPGHVVDIMTTICDITGVEYPESFNENEITSMQGHSISSIFLGEELEHQKPIFWEHEGNRAVRKGDWKLVAKTGEDWELYNVEKDRTELNNIIGSNPEIASELLKKYEAWSISVGVVER